MSVLLFLTIILEARLASPQDSLQTLTCATDSDCHKKVDSKLLSCQNGKCVLMTLAEREQRERDAEKDYSNVVEIPPDNPERKPPGQYPLMITGQRMQGAVPKGNTPPVPAKPQPNKQNPPNSLNSMDNFNIEDELDSLDEGVNESFEDDDIDPRAFLTDEMLAKLSHGESITITPFPAPSSTAGQQHQHRGEIAPESDSDTNRISGEPGKTAMPIGPGSHVTSSPGDGEGEGETEAVPPITLPFTEIPADLTRTGGPRQTEPVPPEPVTQEPVPREQPQEQQEHPHPDHAPPAQESVQSHPILPKIPDHIHYIPAQQLQLPTQIVTQVSNLTFRNWELLDIFATFSDG